MNKFDRSSKPDEVDQRIGKRLREARERLGETPLYVAAALKMNVVDYLEIEAGMRRLGAEPMTRAADLLRVGVPWFFESSGENEACELEADVMLTNIVDLNPARLRKRHTQR